jgi:O-antigen ligase
LALAGLIFGGLVAIQPWMGVALAGAAIVVGLFFWNPAAGLAVLIASRSSLDAFQDATRMQRAFLFNPASALGILLIAMGVILLGVRLRNRQPIEWGGPPGLAWGGWIAISLLGVPVAFVQLGVPGFASAVREFIRLMSTFALYFLVVNLGRDRSSRNLMIAAILLGLVPPALASAGQLITRDYTHSVDGVMRVYGTFVHPGQFGLYLATIIMICLGLWQDSWGGKVGRLWLGSAMLTGSILTVLTATRAAWGILLAALFVRACMLPRRKRIIAISIAFVFSAAVAPFVAWRFQDLLEGGDPSAERTNSFLWRLLNFYQLLQIFRESPIVGYGLRTTGMVNPTRTETAEGYERGFAAHSELIRVLVEQGILGLIAYIVMAVLLISSVRRMIPRGSGSATQPEVARALFALLISAFMLAPLGAELLGGTALMYVILTVVGVLHAGRTDRAILPDAGKRP